MHISITAPSFSTTKAHIGTVYKKLGIHNREGLFKLISGN